MKNFRLIVSTQIKENYGAHEWNGQGECPQYWKYKGGNDHIASAGNLRRVVRAWKANRFAKFSRADDYWVEYPLSVTILLPGEETEDEKRDAWLKERGYN